MPDPIQDLDKDTLVPVQTIYEVGIRLHQIVTAKHVWQARSIEKFREIWEEAIEVVKKEYPDLPIDWTFRDE